MRIAYDRQSHGLFIRFSPGAYDESEEVSPGIVVDFDREGKPIAVEFADVRGIIDEKMLEKLTRPRIKTGADLRDFRERLGITQETLALLLDIPRNTIARWEREEMAIEKLRLLELALASLTNRTPTRPPTPGAVINERVIVEPRRRTKKVQTLKLSERVHARSIGRKAVGKTAVIEDRNRRSRSRSKKR